MALVIAAPSTAAATIRHTDSRGKTVQIDVPVHRAAIFEFYEVLPALDCWDRIAAIGRSAYENDLLRVAKPDLRTQIPSAGTSETVEIETLLKVKPQVVIAWPYKPENIQFMEDKGLKVVTIFPSSIADLYDLIRLHGAMFEREARAENAISAMEDIFGMVRSHAVHVPVGARKRILWMGGRQNSVYGSVGMSNKLIDMIGGQNVAAGIALRYPNVSVETIVSWNPEVIFIWSGASFGPEDLFRNPQWRFVKAVRERHVYKTPTWSTWSPRLAPFVLWLAKKTYPNLYRDVDLQKVTDAFYRKVFGIPFRKTVAYEP